MTKLFLMSLLKFFLSIKQIVLVLSTVVSDIDIKCPAVNIQGSSGPFQAMFGQGRAIAQRGQLGPTEIGNVSVRKARKKWRNYSR